MRGRGGGGLTKFASFASVDRALCYAFARALQTVSKHRTRHNTNKQHEQHQHPQTKKAEFAAAMARYKQAAGITELDPQAMARAEKLYAAGLDLMSKGQIAQALEVMNEARDVAPLKTRIGGLATLQAAICYDTLGAAAQAQALYKVRAGWRRLRGRGGDCAAGGGRLPAGPLFCGARRFGRPCGCNLCAFLICVSSRPASFPSPTQHRRPPPQTTKHPTAPARPPQLRGRPQGAPPGLRLPGDGLFEDEIGVLRRRQGGV